MDFSKVYELLKTSGPTVVEFSTVRSKVVEIWASEMSRGKRKGEKVIRVQWASSSSTIGAYEWENSDSGLLKHLRLSMESKLSDYIIKASNSYKLTTPESTILIPEKNLVVVENWNEIIKAITKDSKLLYKLPWDKFEDLMAKLLGSFGWDISPLGRTKDEGIDIVVTKLVSPDINFQMMVQCKKYSEKNKVGLDVVKNVYSSNINISFFHSADEFEIVRQQGTQFALIFARISEEFLTSGFEFGERFVVSVIQGFLFEEFPEAFDQIQIRRIGREEYELDA